MSFDQKSDSSMVCLIFWDKGPEETSKHSMLFKTGFSTFVLPLPPTNSQKFSLPTTEEENKVNR